MKAENGAWPKPLYVVWTACSRDVLHSAKNLRSEVVSCIQEKIYHFFGTADPTPVNDWHCLIPSP